MNRPPYWDKTITVLNKLSARDSVTKLDTWVKTTLTGCFYKQATTRDVSGTTVSLGTSVVCRIPRNPDYKPYHIWKNDITSGFTLSPGDYIFKGELAEDITAQNIVSVYNAHKPDAMLIRAVSDNSDVIGLIEHYKAEGI